MAAVQSLRYKQTSRGNEEIWCVLEVLAGLGWAPKHPQQRSPGLPGMATTSGPTISPFKSHCLGLEAFYRVI